MSKHLYHAEFLNAEAAAEDLAKWSLVAPIMLIALAAITLAAGIIAASTVVEIYCKPSVTVKDLSRMH